MVDQAAIPSEKHFKIGLAMSGAISAGAYTAGVFDFLVEALSEWEKEKAKLDAQGNPLPGVPRHQVSIVGMAGASAGSITAAVGIASVARGLQPSQPQPPATTPKATDIPYHNLPELYQAWVESIDFADQEVDNPNGGRKILNGLLNTADLVAIKNSNPSTIQIDSALNCSALATVGEFAIASGRPSTGDRPAWLSGDLHLFLTLTNLRGVPYSITFQSGDDDYPYVMSSHGDWAHYCIQNLGTANFHSEWAHAGYHDLLSVTDLPNMPGDIEKTPVWKRYVTHAISSGAFPVGLSAQSLQKPIQAYDQKIFPLPYPMDVMKTVKAHWPQKFADSKPEKLSYAAVDGGALDNDPFQVLRYALMDKPPEDGPCESKNADRCVILISPFPEPPEFQLDDKIATELNLPAVLKGLVSTFMQNSRYKPAELLRTSDVNNVSSWRIGPSRWSGKTENFAIASGLVGGFGGFLKQDFRRHDYELGRQNCQRFLGHWFGVDQDNPNIDPAVCLPIKIGQEDIERVKVPTRRAALIPLYGTALIPVQVRDWPTITQQDFRNFKEKVYARLDAFWEALPSLGFWKNRYIEAGWYMGVRGMIRSAILDAMAKDLIRRGQYLDGQKFAGLNDNQVDVLAIFLKESYTSNWTGPNGLKLSDIKDALKNKKDIDSILPSALDALVALKILAKKATLFGTAYWTLTAD